MTLKNIKCIGVIGAGTMGRGIAHLLASYDYNVVLIDKSEDLLEEALFRIKHYTDPLDWDRVEARINPSTDISKAGDCDIIIEAVYEDPALKKEVFKTLSHFCKKEAIIATNTSSISINELSEAVVYPSRFAGMHFMNPPKVMKLVEIVKGEETSEETVSVIGWLARDLEKVPVVVNDTPGFVANRLLFALIGEAMRLFEKGIATKEEIDSVMKYGVNHPMGPFELADYIGLDISLKVMEYLYGELNDEKYKPPPILETLVNEGKLGRKTKEGFYKYE